MAEEKKPLLSDSLDNQDGDHDQQHAVSGHTNPDYRHIATHQHNQSPSTERQGIPTERQGAPTTECQDPPTERQGPSTERKALSTEHKSPPPTEHQGLSTEHQGLSTEHQGLSTECQGLSTEQQGYPTEKRGLFKAWSGQASESQTQKNLTRYTGSSRSGRDTFEHETMPSVPGAHGSLQKTNTEASVPGSRPSDQLHAGEEQREKAVQTSPLDKHLVSVVPNQIHVKVVSTQQLQPHLLADVKRAFDGSSSRYGAFGVTGVGVVVGIGSGDGAGVVVDAGGVVVNSGGGDADIVVAAVGGSGGGGSWRSGDVVAAEAGDPDPATLPPPPVPDPYCGMSRSRWIRGRIMSTLCLSLYIAAGIGYSPLVSQYIYYRLAPTSIRDVNTTNFNTDSCDINKTDPRLREISLLQKRTSKAMLYQSLASTGPMIITTLILGIYSDVVGRKFLFYIPTVVGTLRMLGIFFVVSYNGAVWWFYVLCVFDSLGGGFTALLMATFAYTADLTPPNASRTIAIAIIESCIAAAGSGADLGVGYFISYWGFKYAALLLTGILFLSVVSLFLLPETVKHNQHNQQPSVPGQQMPTRNPFKYVAHFLSMYWRDSTKRQKVRFAVAMTMLQLAFIPIMGRGSTEVLYQLNLPFCWNSDMVGLFGGAYILARAIGSVLAVHLLQSCCQFSDASIAFITLFSCLAYNSLYGIASMPFMGDKASLVLWASIAAGCVGAAPIPTSRAILSKMAGPSRQGALFASIAVVETISTLLSNTMYNEIYQATVDIIQGMVFLVMGGVVLLNIFLIVVFKFIPPEQSQVYEQEIPDPDLDDDDDAALVQAPDLANPSLQVQAHAISNPSLQI